MEANGLDWCGARENPESRLCELPQMRNQPVIWICFGGCCAGARARGAHAALGLCIWGCDSCSCISGDADEGAWQRMPELLKPPETVPLQEASSCSES